MAESGDACESHPTQIRGNRASNSTTNNGSDSSAKIAVRREARDNHQNSGSGGFGPFGGSEQTQGEGAGVVYDTKGEIWGSPLWVDGKVYIGTGDGDMHILQHGKTMKPLGKVEMNDGQIYSAPVVANGVLYVMTMKSLWAIANK